MLSVYIYEGIFALRIYVTITSPYPWDPGVTSWYQSLGSHIFSITSWQINDILICNWRAQVLDIHSNRKCGVIYFFLAIYFLDPETLLSFSLQLLPDIPSTNLDMKRWGTRNGPGTSRDSSNWESDNMMRVLHGMKESQHQQTEFLRQVLLIAPREQRSGNVSDFGRLQPAIFSGTKRPLDTEQWLIDTTILWRQLES